MKVIEWLKKPIIWVKIKYHWWCVFGFNRTKTTNNFKRATSDQKYKSRLKSHLDALEILMPYEPRMYDPDVILAEESFYSAWPDDAEMAEQALHRLVEIREDPVRQTFSKIGAIEALLKINRFLATEETDKDLDVQ